MSDMLKVDTSLAMLDRVKPTIDKSLDDKKLKEQTDKFEAYFIKQIFDIALKSDNPLFGKDAADKIYRSMYNDALSQKSAGSFGYSELLFNYLKENQ
jgi:Rod binding domain-containing protein